MIWTVRRQSYTPPAVKNGPRRAGSGRRSWVARCSWLSRPSAWPCIRFVLVGYRKAAVAVTGDDDRPNFRRGLQLATRSAVSATLAYSIAQALKLDYPIFALAAAVIATDLTPARSRELGFRRLVATAIGGLSGALAASMNLVGIWAVAPSILIASARASAQGARIAGYICGIIVLLDNGDSPWRYALFRTVETALGVLLAWGISYVPKLTAVV